MLFDETQKRRPTTRLTSKGILAPACLGLAFIFLATVLMSGCVVHHQGHGYKHQGHGYKRGHGHHKSKIKIKPAVGIAVSPMIVIDD